MADTAKRDERIAKTWLILGASDDFVGKGCETLRLPDVKPPCLTGLENTVFRAFFLPGFRCCNAATA